MNQSFEGKTALITGGSAGIGRATAVAFGEQKANVVVAARREAQSLQTVRLVEAAGGNAVFVRTDVTAPDDVENMVQTAISEYGSLDFAFNNAGILGNRMLLHEYSEEDWDYYSDALQKSVWRSMKFELMQMLKQGHGVIVNNSSVAGYRSGPGPGYAAGKHAVIGMTRAAAKQYGEHGIRVNAVAPGWIETEMTEGWADDPTRGQSLIQRQAIKRPGTPEEIASIVQWLCSESAAFTTGAVMVVDGGLSM